MTEALSDAERDRLERAPLTYPQVGVSRDGTTIPGYRALSVRREVGVGVARLEQAASRLLTWQAHRQAGLSVVPSSEHVADGTVAVLHLGLGPVKVAAPVRVVHVIDDPRRQGFAYGTLPGHPESGEELFLLTLRDDDVVEFSIIAVSRPSSLLARLGGPAARAVQDRITARYLASV